VSPRAAWAGVVVRDLDESLAWWASEVGGQIAEREPSWAKLRFTNGTTVELFAGDPADPGAVFPSYGPDPGPPILPGYALDDPEGAAEAGGLEVVRSLPGWVVVVAPDRLRIVLLTADVRRGPGLVGFRLTSTSAGDQRAFLDELGIAGPEVVDGEVAVVPIVRGRRAGSREDPDGRTVELVARASDGS
jgi:catechol 2,3-dioxygenase-like lactoylglutathione lyase family enzyme